MDWRVDVAEIDLPSLQVASKGQGNAARHGGEYVRFMGEKDRWIVVIDRARRCPDVVNSTMGAEPEERVGALVAEPDQPEWTPVLQQPQRLIFQHWDSGRLDRPAHPARSVGRVGWDGRRPPIVISEYGIVPGRRLESAKLLCPGARRDVSGDERTGAYKIVEQYRQDRASGRWRG